MMTPFGTIFRSGSNKPPKIDQHSLFTSIQVSVAVLEGDLQIYEPWRRKRNRPKECHVTLYANETSPFLVWHKLDKGRNTEQPAPRSSTSEYPASPNKPRCVISVSRARLTKTAGGSFEMTDFASNLTFRFIAKTIREAVLWVEKLAEESLREANLDMRSICSSCSSSTSSFPSPVATPSDASARFFPFPTTPDRAAVVNVHRKSASFSEATITQMQFFDSKNGKENSSSLSKQNDSGDDLAKSSNSTESGDVFAVKSAAEHIAASKLGHTRSSSKTFPRIQNSRSSAGRMYSQQPHVRAQPHLGLNVLDKHRPELRNVITDIPIPTKPKVTNSNLSELPFSEYFVNVPST